MQPWLAANHVCRVAFRVMTNTGAFTLPFRVAAVRYPVLVLASQRRFRNECSPYTARNIVVGYFSAPRNKKSMIRLTALVLRDDQVESPDAVLNSSPSRQ